MSDPPRTDGRVTNCPDEEVNIRASTRLGLADRPMIDLERVSLEIRRINANTRNALARARDLADVDAIKRTARARLDLLEEQAGGKAADPKVGRAIAAARHDL